MISVVLPCYHEPRELFVQALKSMLCQTYHDIELIVIVDGPNLDLEQVLYQYQETDRRLRFFVNEVNRGLPYSLNRGISLATGKYIARMDADDISLVERLRKELRYLEENELDLVGTYCETISDAGEHVGFMRGPISTSEIYRTLPKRNCMWHPTWLFRKEVWEQVGGYDSFRGCEDYHFLLKARKLGIRLGVMPEVCLKYRLTRGGLSRERSAMTKLLVEYFKSHCENILEVTPDSVAAYLVSIEGKEALREFEEYFRISDQFHNKKGMQKIMYGMRLFCFEYGRKQLRNYIANLIRL